MYPSTAPAQRLLVCALLWLTQPACAPSSYPRLAEVARPGALRFAGATNVAESMGRATARSPAQVAAGVHGKVVDSNAAPVNGGEFPGVWLFAPVWAEGQLAVGIVEPCELGGTLSILRIGLEARCALLQPREHVVGVALGTALIHHSLFGSDVGAAAFQWRATLEVSGAVERYTPLVNLVVSYGRTQRSLDDLGLTPPNTHPNERYDSIFMVRNEWKLALPVGFNFPMGQRVGLLLGFVPEWTVHAGHSTTDCGACLDKISDVTQALALFGTIGMTGFSQ